MKILLIADTEKSSLWEHWTPERTEGIDLILSLGDLKPEYLEFLVTVTNRPLYYVRGNHDSVYGTRPPLGCVSLEDRIVQFGGLRILGLGGSMRYREGTDMYTEREMARRIRKLRWKIRRAGGIDLLATHSPAYGYGDREDLAHTGFRCLNELLEAQRPKFHCYAHVHQEYGNFTRILEHPGGSLLINGSGMYVLDTETFSELE